MNENIILPRSKSEIIQKERDPNNYASFNFLKASNSDDDESSFNESHYSSNKVKRLDSGFNQVEFRFGNSHKSQKKEINSPGMKSAVFGGFENEQDELELKQQSSKTVEQPSLIKLDEIQENTNEQSFSKVEWTRLICAISSIFGIS